MPPVFGAKAPPIPTIKMFDEMEQQEQPGDFVGRRERLLRLLAALAFLIFFQAYMVPPLIPRLAELFQVSVGRIGLAVPAYLIPYGFAVLLYVIRWFRFRQSGFQSLFAVGLIDSIVGIWRCGGAGDVICSSALPERTPQLKRSVLLVLRREP